MGVTRIYLSFDFDHDAELRGSFVGQARVYSPHRIVDWSLPAAVDGRWTRDVQKRNGSPKRTSVLRLPRHSNQRPTVSSVRVRLRQQRNRQLNVPNRLRHRLTDQVQTGHLLDAPDRMIEFALG